MGNSRNTGFINNIIKYDANGNVNIVSGSTTLLYISSSGAITTTGVISGSNALSASYAASASNALAAATASYILTAQTASYVLNGVSASYAASASNALSASNAVTAQTASYANTFTVASTLTAQTLVVQTITSSVDFVTGSTRFGSLSSNTHVFTGSVLVSGSITTGTANVARGTAFTSPFLTNGGNLATTAGSTVRLGSFSFDAGGNSVGLGIYGLRQATGSNWTTTGIKLQLDVDNSTDLGGNLFISSNGNVGIGTTNPQALLHLSGPSNILQINASSGYEIFITGSDSANIYYATPNQAIFLNTNGGPLYLGTSAASTLLTVTGSNVGMGISNPDGPLDVYKSTTGGLGGHIILRNNGSAVANETAVLFVDGGIGSVRAAISSTTENSPYYGDIKFKTGASAYSSLSTRMIITGAGNVGIGTTTPTAILQVRGPNATGVFFDAQNVGAGGAVFSRINVSSSPYNQYVFNNGYVGIGRTPLSQLAVLGGPIQIMQDYPGHQTIIRSTGASGGYNGQLTITIPEMAGAGVSQGFGGYSCEVYVSGFNGMYCHAWFSGYINNGITAGEATILRSNGGWSLSQTTTGGFNQGLIFYVDYPAGLTHPTARIIFNKGGDPNIAEYNANAITATWS